MREVLEFPLGLLVFLAMTMIPVLIVGLPAIYLIRWAVGPCGF